MKINKSYNGRKFYGVQTNPIQKNAMSMRRIGRKTQDSIVKSAPWLFKKQKPGIQNWYTGVKATKGAAITLGLGAIAWGVGSAAIEQANRSQRVAQENIQEDGNLPGLSYDGVGNINQGRRDLGATGDIVFGLNKTRNKSMGRFF